MGEIQRELRISLFDLYRKKFDPKLNRKPDAKQSRALFLQHKHLLSRFPGSTRKRKSISTTTRTTTTTTTRLAQGTTTLAAFNLSANLVEVVSIRK
jgi:hypothetical protein